MITKENNMTLKKQSIRKNQIITVSGHRIIQESALCANRHMNKVMRNEIKLDI